MVSPKDKLFRGRIREKHVRIPALRAAAARKDGYILTSLRQPGKMRKFSMDATTRSSVRSFAI